MPVLLVLFELFAGTAQDESEVGGLRPGNCGG